MFQRLLHVLSCGISAWLSLSAPGALAANDASINIDVAAAAQAPPLAAELFGIAWNWTDAGGGVIEYGELIRDRSFRNQSELMARAWVESPNKAVHGELELVNSGGDPHPIAGIGYPGYFRLTEQAQGYTCIAQEIREGVTADAEYELHLSGVAEEGHPAVSAFFADDASNPLEKSLSSTVVATNQWSDYAFTLTPTRSLPKATLRICQVTPGTLGIDEIRLHMRGSAPRVRPLADTKIHALGVRSLRWPTGSDADYFDWQQSIGPLLQRGENPSAFGVLQTPSLGLHEFLDYCERSGIIPLLTVNVREPPQHAADLVEYVLGPATTPMGALRARNGHPAPWPVRYFELGNEPVDLYRGTQSKSDAAIGYAEIASAVAVAMRERATAIQQPINLQGVLETSFATVDWIMWAPMLAKWNAAILGTGSPLRAHLDQVKGNFYSAFNHRSDDGEMFAEVMGGGATIVDTSRVLNAQYGPLPPFWITEYSVMVQKKKLLFGSEIQLDRTNDYQAGMAVADILLSVIDGGFGGAYMFNLAARGTWGVLENNLQNHADFDVGPAGLAFSLVSPLAGLRKAPVTVTGSDTVTLTKGDGSSPAKTHYATLAAVAAVGTDRVEVSILNRSFDKAYRLHIITPGFVPHSAEIYQLKSDNVRAKNIDGADQVRIEHSSTPLNGALEIDLAPKSLLRISYPKS